MADQLKLEIGKTYLTRTGEKVRIICIDRQGINNHYPVIGLRVIPTSKEENVEKYSSEGYFYEQKKIDIVEQHIYDLIKEYKEPKTKTIWIWLYERKGALYTCFSSEGRSVETYNGYAILAKKQITLTEGEGM